ncbi:MAG: fatty acid CoA ligase family protein [Myxococcota bacterium]
MNIASVVLERARSEPDATAIFTLGERGATGGPTTATNGALDRSSDRFAWALSQAGIARGTRTALLVRPGLELFGLMLALFKLGAVPVVIDPGIGLRRFGRCLEEAEPEAFVGIPLAQWARRVLGWGRSTLRTKVTVGRGPLAPAPRLSSLAERVPQDEPFPVAPTGDADPAAILFTSGSTGPPKGVLYTHGHFAAQIEAVRALGDIRPGEVDLATFPPFALFDPALGMTSVVPDMDPTRPGSVDPHAILEPAERYGATNLFGSPALLDTVAPRRAPDGTPRSKQRRVVSAGAPVSADVMRRFLALLPDDAELLTPYGATECLPVSCISSREVLGETAARTAEGEGVCVGQPVPSIDVRILAIDDGPIETIDAARALPEGEIGEITVRGPQATACYVGRPKATALAKIRGGDGTIWHRMGDVGYRDHHGRIWYCGRKADRVETTDATFFPSPCEGVFDAHPAVRRSALVGVPEGDGTLRPAICVEAEPGTGRAAKKALIAELRAMAERHAHTRAITDFLFHPGFPVDIRHNAKIDRPALARWAARRLGRRAT